MESPHSCLPALIGVWSEEAGLHKSAFRVEGKQMKLERLLSERQQGTCEGDMAEEINNNQSTAKSRCWLYSNLGYHVLENCLRKIYEVNFLVAAYQHVPCQCHQN